MMSQALPVKPKRWWWLLLASFAVCLVVLAPAALFDWAMSGAPNPTLRFASESGTIWTGRGRINIASDTSPVVIPIGWRFDPISLLRLRVGFFVTANAAALAGTTHMGWRFGDIELRDTMIETDARLLSMAHAAGALFAPTGKIRLQQLPDERLNMKPASNEKEAWRVNGSIGLTAEQLALAGAFNTPASNVELKLQGDGTAINVAILRSSGPLKLEGTGTLALTAPRRFTFSGFATVASDAPAALKQIGPTMADGRQRIEINTPW